MVADLTREQLDEGHHLLEALAEPKKHGHGCRGRDDIDAYVAHYAMKNLAALLSMAERTIVVEAERDELLAESVSALPFGKLRLTETRLEVIQLKKAARALFDAVNGMAGGALRERDLCDINYEMKTLEKLL